MIINSKFKDYYDYVAHQYRDERTVWNREERNFGRNFGEVTPDDLSKASDELAFGISSGVGHADDHSVDAVIIGGKVYQYFHHRRYTDNTRTAIQSYFKEKTIQEITAKQMSAWRYFFDRSKFKEYEWGEYVPKYNDLCVQYGPIIWFRDRGITVNPCFREEPTLMKVLDPYNIIQDIMACIGSVEPHIPEMDNLTKIESAGFDKKQSFRHRK